MYDIRPLEKEWKRYRKKKLVPLYIGSIVFVLLLSFAFFNFYGSKMHLNTFSDYLNTVKNSIASEEVKSESVPQFKSNVVINGPLIGLEVEKKLIDEPETAEETSANILVDIPILDGNEEEPLNVLEKARKKVHLDIIKTTNFTAYKDVEERFRQSKDIEDSLFLARSYYKNGNYKKAEFWALETNKVDSNIEESMLIFVKSKMKLGQTNEARNILTTYIKKSNSQEAKKLLYSIENGKF